MEGSSLRSILQEKTWLPKKEKTSSTLAQEGIILEKTLGEGAYAKVKSAYYEKLKKKVAVKIISKHKVPKDFVSKFLIREITMMAELDHPNIIRLIAVFESDDKIFIVMELAEGGDLLDHVNQKKYNSEEEIRKHCLQFASAMSYSHQMGIVHRDLKLENIVLDRNGNIKITDYGFARQTVKGNTMETHCGSYAYACPKILRSEPYDGFAADVWSMGIVLYTLFTYRLPYTEVELKVLASGGVPKKLKFTKDTPQAARDLIRKMLDQSDETRITCQQILNHDWVRDGSLATVKNEEAASEIAPDAPASTKVGNETSGASIIESSDSIQARIPRVNDVTDNEDDPEEEKQFQVMSVRRSTLTSENNQKILSNFVKPKDTNFANTVRKKRVALLCLGGLGKKKKNEADEPRRGSGSGAEKEEDHFCDIVTQIVKSKKGQQIKTFHVEVDRNELQEDESIEQMRRELACLSQEDSATIVTMKSEKSRQGSIVEIKKDLKKKGKWKKICSKMTK